MMVMVMVPAVVVVMVVPAVVVVAAAGEILVDVLFLWVGVGVRSGIARSVVGCQVATGGGCGSRGADDCPGVVCAT